jgi:hypothetical protein
MKTERLFVLVSEKEKRAIARRAKALDLNVSEYLRRAAQDYRSDEERASEALLNQLAVQLEEAAKAMRADLRRAIEATETYFRKQKEASHEHA